MFTFALALTVFHCFGNQFCMYPVWPLIAVYALMTTGDFHFSPKMLCKRCWSLAQIGIFSSKCTSGWMCTEKPTTQNILQFGIKSMCKKNENYPLKIHVVPQMVSAVAWLIAILVNAAVRLWPRLECIFAIETAVLFYELRWQPEIENYVAELIRCTTGYHWRLALQIEIKSEQFESILGQIMDILWKLLVSCNPSSKSFL